MDFVVSPGEPLPDIGRLTDDELRHMAGDSRQTGDHQTALRCYEEAANRHPDHPGVLLECLRSHHKLRHHGHVAILARRIGHLISRHAALLDQFGGELQNLLEFELALEIFASLRNFPQKDVRAVGKAREALLHLRTGQLAEAGETLMDAESLEGGLPEVRYARALICRQTDPALAREILQQLSHPAASVPAPFIASCAHALAAVCDSLNLEDEAMDALACGKTLEVRQPLVAQFRSQRSAWRQWHRDALDFTNPQAAAWHQAAMACVSPAHAFLLGHPRSGTTLLEQILDAHPGIVSAEETDLYATLIESALIRSHARDAAAMPFNRYLHDLPDSRMGALRAAYCSALSREAGGASGDLMFMDKNPSLTTSVGTLPRTMPMSRIICMLRDPRDVCLSAYFQSVDRTPWSVNWLTLEETVGQYVFAMDLWLKARPLLAQPWIEIKYEALVRDPISEGKKVTAFLGLRWHAAQEDPAAHARSRNVKSPTHADVVRPVHQRAVGKWLRYAKYLDPFREKLAPFVAAFGYDG